MHLDELLADLAQYTGALENNVLLRVRELRRAGMLAERSRGGGTRPIAPRDVARLLAGLIAARTVDAADTAATYLGLRRSSGDQSIIPSAHSVAAAFEAVLTDPACELGVKLIRVCRTWPWVEIVAEHGRSRHFGYTPDEDSLARARRAGYRPAPVREFIEFPISILSQLALDLGGAAPADVAEVLDTDEPGPADMLAHEAEAEPVTADAGWADSAAGAEAAAAFARDRASRR